MVKVGQKQRVMCLLYQLFHFLLHRVLILFRFLANVHVRYLLSPVCLSSVICNVRAPYSGGSNFWQYFYSIKYLPFSAGLSLNSCSSIRFVFIFVLFFALCNPLVNFYCKQNSLWTMNYEPWPSIDIHWKFHGDVPGEPLRRGRKTQDWQPNIAILGLPKGLSRKRC